MGIAVTNGVIIEGPQIQSYDPAHDKADHFALFKSWFGGKCPDRMYGCAGCHAWHIFEEYWRMMQEVVDDANCARKDELPVIQEACGEEE